MGSHAFLPRNEAAGLARRTPWGHRGACECGWVQEGLAGKKQALRSYYEHVNEQPWDEDDFDGES